MGTWKTVKFKLTLTQERLACFFLHCSKFMHKKVALKTQLQLHLIPLMFLFPLQKHLFIALYSNIFTYLHFHFHFLFNLPLLSEKGRYCIFFTASSWLLYFYCIFLTYLYFHYIHSIYIASSLLSSYCTVFTQICIHVTFKQLNQPVINSSLLLHPLSSSHFFYLFCYSSLLNSMFTATVLHFIVFFIFILTFLSSTFLLYYYWKAERGLCPCLGPSSIRGPAWCKCSIVLSIL